MAKIKKKLISDGKDEHRKGILAMKVHEGVKLQLCYLLHHLNDVQVCPIDQSA
jgi:hypothetical protein